MRFNPSQNLIISFFIFILLFTIGLSLSQRKLLWLDEIFTQSKSIDSCSYKDILLANFTEGNKNPLFYIAQKSICDIFSFKLSIPITPELTKIRDQRTQIITRLFSNICMSLAIVLIFYYFLRYHSFYLGLYALGLLLINPMVWMYWVEVRPYSLWFLLTTIQVLILCRLILNNHNNSFKVRLLFLAELLLALTTIASIFQILIAAIVLWRIKLIKQLLLVSVIPLGIAIYYFLTIHVYTIKAFAFWPYLFDAVLPEHFPIFIIYALCMVWSALKSKKIFENSYFLTIFLLFLSSVCLILWIYMNKPAGQFGFSNRYLIFMVPVDVLMFCFVTSDFLKLVRTKTAIWINTMIFLGGLLLMRALITYIYILALGTYLHAPN